MKIIDPPFPEIAGFILFKLLVLIGDLKKRGACPCTLEMISNTKTTLQILIMLVTFILN